MKGLKPKQEHNGGRQLVRFMAENPSRAEEKRPSTSAGIARFGKRITLDNR
jgi:hypothetical protein